MCGIFVRRIQGFLGIGNSYEERLGQFVFKLRSKAIVFKTFTSYNLVSLSLSGYGYFRKCGALAFHKVRHFNIADLCDLVDEGEGKILFSGFVSRILFRCKTDFLCQRFLG